MERKSFIQSILVALEQSIRFFTDYLNGDNYYKISYPKQNLERGLNQIAFARKMLLREEEVQNYINSLFKINGIMLKFG